MKSTEQKLFELLLKSGEFENGIIHIIDNTDSYRMCEGEGEFRVYHKGGYCFDVKKEVETEDEETGKLTYFYSVYQEWDGFDKLDDYLLLDLVKKSLRRKN